MHLEHEGSMKATVMVQASIPTAPSVIQAEAQALLLAARIAAGLKLQQQTFLTDNITLAQAATAGPDCLQEVPWEIRRYIADYIQISSLSTGSTSSSSRSSSSTTGGLCNTASAVLRPLLPFPNPKMRMELPIIVLIRLCDKICLSLSTVVLVQLIETIVLSFPVQNMQCKLTTL
jgi:hypothetical protein